MTKLDSFADDGDDTLDFETLAELRGDGEGELDHACPLCGPACQQPFNRTRPVLRTWEPQPGFITYNCVRCEAKGYAHGDAAQMSRPPSRPRPPPPDDTYRLLQVNQIWNGATPGWHPAVKAYFRFRGIALTHVPQGALRFHPECPWWKKRVPCVVARYSDAVTGELRGIWRRSIDGLNKPMTLGPMGGCVIRLWPDISDRLVIGEGIETVLAAASRMTHRGLPLYPAWAAGCAGNLRRLPVLDGVKQLVILVDNDASGTGQRVAAECAARWRDAGREVIRLMPTKLGTDFNDLVRP
jgi:Toprim domain